MGRPERPLDVSSGPVARFAQDLRSLRAAAGVTYRKMAAGSPFSVTTLAQAAGGERFPSLPVVLAYALACGAEADVWERRWHETSRALASPAATNPARDGEDDGEAPYRGLRRFEPGDHTLFFGREDLVLHVADRSAQHPVVALVGASGSGKSSLLRAGLIPVAQRDGLGGEPLAALRVLTPGARPATAHAERLKPAPGPGSTLVVVDQFEEVFTLAEPQERGAFLDMIASAAADGSGLRIVIGIRADFLARCAQQARLAVAIRDATVVVGPMDAASLRQVIVRPAAAAGLIVERALTARMIREAQAEPGSLPLLSHALLETWRRRRGRALTEAMYEAAGGLHGAIATTAEDSFATLSPQSQAVARNILLRLVTPGEAGPDTRRPVPRRELEPAFPQATEVLDHLVRARLLTVDNDSVDLAHEALLTAWPRYRGWIDQDRDRLRLHHVLSDAAHTWAELGHDAGALLRGSRLVAALETFAPSGTNAAPFATTGGEPWGLVPGAGELTSLEALFLKASQAAREAERRAQARTLWRMRALTVALSVLLVLALTATVAAVAQRTTAERARDRAVASQQVALSRQLAADSLASADTDPDLGALLAVQAYRTRPTSEALAALDVAAANPLRLQLDGGLAVTGEAFSPDGRTLCWSEDGAQVRCADTTTGSIRTLPSVVGGADGPHLTALQFHDSHTVLTTDSFGVVRTTDLATGRSRPKLTRTAPDVAALMSGDGRTVATVDRPVGADVKDGIPYGNTDVTVRDVATGAVRTVVHVPPEPRTEGLAPNGGYLNDIGADLLAVSPDGRLVATATGWVKEDEDTALVTIWSATTGRSLTTLRPGSDPLAAAFSPDGRRLAVEGDGSVRVWDTTTARSTTVHPAAGHDGAVVSALAFSRDGSALAVADDATAVSVVDLTTGRDHVLHARTARDKLGSADHPVTTRLAFSGDGSKVAAGDSAGHVRVWDTAGALPYVSVSAQATRYSTTAVLADDGRTLAVPQDDGGIRLVDTRTGRASRDLPALGHPAALLVAPARGPLLGVVDNAGSAVHLWDLSTRTERTLPLAGSFADAAVLSPDGSRITAHLQSSRRYGRAVTRTWDTRTGRIERSPAPFAADTLRPYFGYSPDGRSLAVSTPGGDLKLLDVRSGRLRASWTTFDNHIPGFLAPRGFAFGPDSRTLVSGRPDGDVELRDVPSGRVRSALAAGASAAALFAFSPDGRSLAVADNSGAVQVWDLATARVRVTYQDSSPVTFLAFGAGGTALAVARMNGRTQLWHPETVDAPHAVTQLCRAVGRGLTPEEIHRYLPSAPSVHACS
jgi:WD40 repeat protein/transcriptional regulator with XRE-family HTH domain